MQNYVQHWTEGCQVPTDGERRAAWSWKYFSGGYAPMPTLFAERLAEQGRKLSETQIRQRERFASEYARMEAATANCRDEEDCSDLG